MKIKTLFLSFISVLELVSCIRGVWFAVSGSVAAYSPEGISKVVNKCLDTNIDTIYFSVWDQSQLNFIPSTDFSEQYPFVKVNQRFRFDPLTILIQESHKRGIKIIAWFQYGFATTYNDETGGPILQAKPEWKSLDQSGKITTKNNFQWMNAFHPEVRQFMIKMISSLLWAYPDIDGIQGDDRMPAMPSLAGYDGFTKNLYKQDHNGNQPPLDIHDEEWVQWRCNILNSFAQLIWEQFSLFQGKKYEIHMAPSVYPWSKNEYLQDWPTWINNGFVDLIIPQIYRYDIGLYSTTLQQNLNFVAPECREKLIPGVLIGVGSNPSVNAGILDQSLKINKALNLSGESLFYHESIFDERVAEILQRN